MGQKRIQITDIQKRVFRLRNKCKSILITISKFPRNGTFNSSKLGVMTQGLALGLKLIKPKMLKTLLLCFNWQRICYYL